jgi:hypothetical protein
MKKEYRRVGGKGSGKIEVRIAGGGLFPLYLAF